MMPNVEVKPDAEAKPDVKEKQKIKVPKNMIGGNVSLDHDICVLSFVKNTLDNTSFLVLEWLDTREQRVAEKIYFDQLRGTQKTEDEPVTPDPTKGKVYREAVILGDLQKIEPYCYSKSHTIFPAEKKAFDELIAAEQKKVFPRLVSGGKSVLTGKLGASLDASSLMEQKQSSIAYSEEKVRSGLGGSSTAASIDMLRRDGKSSESWAVETLQTVRSNFTLKDVTTKLKVYDEKRKDKSSFNCCIM